jgi:hypothetical protein
VTLAVCTMFATGSPARSQGNGVPVNGYPSWRERVILVASNACRTGPQQFRDTYLAAYPGILQPATSPATFPLYWTLPLDQSARAHSTDMVTHDFFSHDSFDGTSWYTRIASYYSQSSTLGENIAAGYSTPFAAFLAWITDGGALDGTQAAGHRTNIMASYYHEMGAGYAFGASTTYHYYYTQDLGGGAADYTSPLVAGVHMFTGDGMTTFMAGYYSPGGTAVSNANLMLEGVTIPMSLGFGSSTRGTYVAALPTGTGCRSYYFRFQDAGGNTWLYPEAGQLRTTGEGGCTEEYVSTPAAVGDDLALLRVQPAAPNPFSRETTLRFTLSDAGPMTVQVFDLRGRRVRTLADHWLGAGQHELSWDGNGDRGDRLAPGVYFVSLVSGSTRARQKIVYLGR